MVAPESYFNDPENKSSLGIPTPENRRILVLVAKILQNLANNAEFGTKEAYLEPFNSFVTDNLSKLNLFLRNLADLSNGPKGPTPTIVVSDEDNLVDLLCVHKYLTMYLEKMRNLMKEENSKMTSTNFDLTVTTLESISKELQNNQSSKFPL